jgi:hypothetical protein
MIAKIVHTVIQIGIRTLNLNVTVFIKHQPVTIVCHVIINVQLVMKKASFVTLAVMIVENFQLVIA